MEGFLKTLTISFVVGLLSLVYYFCNVLWLRPENIRGKLRRQGIKGPTPSFFYGNIQEMNRIASEEKTRRETKNVADHYASALFPYFDKWRTDYGPVFTYSTGNSQRLYVSRPDLVKEISLCKSLDLGKSSSVQHELKPLLGQGIILSNGAVWIQKRKIIAPEFFIDKVKGMVSLMVESTIPLLKSWNSRVESEGGIADIKVDEDLRNFSADVISRACFGNSYSHAKEIFSKIRALQETMSKTSTLFGIPGLRYLPTKNNREMWRLGREIESLILKVVNERKEESTCPLEKDLLQIILEGAINDQLGPESTNSFIVDNCKNIYFAGQGTTAVAATWSMMLLASYPEWQARVRAELAIVCGGHLPDADSLCKFKTLTMVIQETLRLYPPATFVSREAFQEMKLGDIDVPKGTAIWISVASLLRDPDIWGPDADEFKPERFEHGVFGACKHPHAYIPFGVGARKCVGQKFAMAELKIVLSMILCSFSFSLSPKYCHSPAFRLVIEPEFGVNILVKRV